MEICHLKTKESKTPDHYDQAPHFSQRKRWSLGTGQSAMKTHICADVWHRVGRGAGGGGAGNEERAAQVERIAERT